VKNIRKEHLNIGLGITLSLLIFELIYVHPVLTSTVFEGGWSIIDVYGNNIGDSYIELLVVYTPKTSGSSIGEFSFPIRTHLLKRCEKNSIILGETYYEIDIIHNNKTIEKIQGRYLGSVKNNGTLAHNVVLLPRNQHTFSAIRNEYGLINIDVSGKILNQASGEMLLSGTTKLRVFIIYPYIKIITFVLLLTLLFLRYL
jgi:hypothetical protein